ncbi:MAG: hypothetical protein IPG72_03200 [Ardenticatenales bacterium]|nr:hypothetical protein [Ardenticatenales bacterium]
MSTTFRVLVCTVFASLALGLSARHIQAAPSRQTRPAEATIELAAGAEGKVPINAFCLNFGEPFPKAVTVSTGAAAAGVVQVMKAAARSATLDVLQTQIAIWHQIEGSWGYKDKDVDMTTAKALAEAAASEGTGALVETGVALDKAITDGSVTATVDGWQVVDAPKALPSDAPYYGSGTLVVKNVSAAPITVRVPLGLVLKAANEAEQDMGLYAVTQVPMEQPAALPKTGFGPPAGRTSHTVSAWWAVVVALAAAFVVLRRRLDRSASRAA